MYLFLFIGQHYWYKSDMIIYNKKWRIFRLVLKKLY